MPTIWIPKRLVEIGLINTAAQAAMDFSCQCELEYTGRVQSTAKEIIKSGAKIVMLTGPSASGKTTTAYKLAQALSTMQHSSEVISLDNFFKNVEDYPRLASGDKDYENVSALDIDAINRCLNELIKTGKTDVPQFDFLAERRQANTQHINLGNGVAIIEGIHALNPLLIELVEKREVYKIYAGLREEYSSDGRRILPTRDIRLARRLVRDYKFRGHSLEKTLGMWPNVCEGENKYIKIFKPNADLLLDTSFSYEVCCLAPLIRSCADDLPKDSPCKETLDSLIRRFAFCESIPVGFIPQQSMLREFIGV